MYADDTAILARNKNPNYIQLALNRHIKALEVWFIKWKIAINASKTEAIMFHKSTTCGNFPQLKIHNETIPWSKQCKYLGVILDTRLTWKSHFLYPSSPTPAVTRPSQSSGKTPPTWFFGHLQRKRTATPLTATNHHQDLYKKTTPPTINSQPRHQRTQKLISSCPAHVSHSIQNYHIGESRGYTAQIAPHQIVWSLLACSHLLTSALSPRISPQPSADPVIGISGIGMRAE
ncbi:hypothetical protein AVEN_126852-1 [Araneus ventricosus]|uniref:Reverse transcriptase domain-containing protein n=1 Tax=Araneus ventricosus TaxID=182803 RepID=A0A4Y2T4X5_ARAVE|nr:hypothetical protein AVEN_126852-1 [Araneus ventricosus]